MNTSLHPMMKRQEIAHLQGDAQMSMSVNYQHSQILIVAMLDAQKTTQQSEESLKWQ